MVSRLPSPSSASHRDKAALFIGGTLILLVGVFFIVKTFFFQPTLDETLDVSGNTGASDDLTSAPTMTTETLLQHMRNGLPLALLDIRTENAFLTEHIAGAVPLSLSLLEQYAPKASEAVVIVYSANDPVTLAAAQEIMAKKSFPYFFLAGGIEAWAAQGGPLISFGDPNSFVDQSKVTYISVAEYQKMLAATSPPPVLLDVQTIERFQEKHLKGAVNLPLAELEKRTSEIPAGRQVVVYGETELVSFQAGVRLFDLGIFSVYVLAGNNLLTNASGLPLEP